LVYPKEAMEKNMQGSVYVRFVVTATGAIGEVQIMRSVDPLLDAAAIEAVKKLPAFTPGRQGGVAVPVYYNMPITFRLAETP